MSFYFLVSKKVPTKFRHLGYFSNRKIFPQKNEFAFFSQAANFCSNPVFYGVVVLVEVFLQLARSSYELFRASSLLSISWL